MSDTFNQSTRSSQLKSLRKLWQEADDIWEANRYNEDFDGYVSSDFEAAFETLCQFQGKVETVLEWGSGLGVVTIMAAQLGFDAYGIELQPILVDYSRELADRYAPEAQFATGSFIPEEFEWDPSDTDESFGTVVDSPSGYDELSMDLRDFDLVYAYPWPGEKYFLKRILRDMNCLGTILVRYEGRDGIQVERITADDDSDSLDY